METKRQASAESLSIPDTLPTPLTEADLQRFFAQRGGGALRLVVGYLEAGETWVQDKRGSRVEYLLTHDLAERMIEGPSPYAEPVLSGQILEYLRAGRVFRILDWLDAHPENRVTDLLTHPEIPYAFRERLRKMLLILMRGELIERLFLPERQAEILSAISGSHKNSKD